MADLLITNPPCHPFRVPVPRPGHPPIRRVGRVFEAHQVPCGVVGLEDSTHPQGWPGHSLVPAAHRERRQLDRGLPPGRGPPDASSYLQHQDACRVRAPLVLGHPDAPDHGGPVTTRQARLTPQDRRTSKRPRRAGITGGQELPGDAYDFLPAGSRGRARSHGGRGSVAREVEVFDRDPRVSQTPLAER